MRLISKLIILYLIVEIIIFLLAASIPVNDQQLVQEFNETESTITSQSYLGKAISIFTHNLLVATIDFIPIIGIILFGFSIASTGIVLSAISTQSHVSGLLVALLLLTLPHSAVELPSYSFSVAAGTYLILRWREWKRALLTFLIAPVELLLAALIEASLFYVPNPYIMWGASVPVLVGIYFLYQYLQKLADKMSPVSASTSTVYPSLAVDQASYFINLADNSFRQASVMEAQQNIEGALNMYWSAILSMIDAIGVRLSMPYYTKEDVDRIINELSMKFDPRISALYQTAYQNKNVQNFIVFKESVRELYLILQGIYQRVSTFSSRISG